MALKRQPKLPITLSNAFARSKERHCFLFPRPASSEEKLQNLDKLEEYDLTKDFLKVGEEFTSFIFQQAPVKQISGKGVNGIMFVNLSKCYFKAIREGQIPCIESAVEYISIAENKKAKEEAIKVYDQEMGALKFPATDKELDSKHQSTQKRALEIFSSKSIFDKSQEHKQSLAKMMMEKFMIYKTKNEESSAVMCRAILKDLHKDIERQVKDGTFLEPGGYASYLNQMEKLERDYNARPGKGVRANAILNEFMKDKQGEQKHILHADKKLRDEEKKIEEQRIKAERAEQMKKTKEEELARTRDEMKSMKKHHEEGMKQYKKDLEKKTAAQIDLIRKTMADQQREHERLLEEGFKEEADLLKEQIKDMREEMERKKDEADEMNRSFHREMMEQVKEMNKAHAKQMEELADRLQPPQKEKDDICFIL